jgi:octaprenyl-diphosphate synthase
MQAPEHTNESNFLHLIAQDMHAVDSLIQQRLSTDVPLVGKISQYIISAGGKRLRPALLLMTCGALGCNRPERINLAAVVEFIHTATLLHDDVVDESNLRRGRATANASFGNAASVLVGDFLYSRAFQMMVECGSMRVMEILAEATNVIAEGEVQQLMNMHDASLGQEAYLRVIRSKTAKLFEASARLAAVITQSDSNTEHACATYGQALGTAFQVIDDALDYEGDSDVMGKNQGDDLREGKVTLPLIVAMQRVSASERAFIQSNIENPPTEIDQLRQNFKRITDLVRQSHALDTTHEAAIAESHRAISALSGFADSPYKTALIKLAEHSVQRLS